MIVTCLISIIGTVFNSFSLKVLHNVKYELKFYDFLRSRCVTSLFVCFLGIFLFSSSVPCQRCLFDYWTLYLQFYLVFIPLRIALMASGISDILLGLNRVAVLYERKKCFFYSISKIVTSYFFYFKEKG